MAVLLYRTPFRAHQRLVVWNWIQNHYSFLSLIKAITINSEYWSLHYSLKCFHFNNFVAKSVLLFFYSNRMSRSLDDLRLCTYWLGVISNASFDMNFIWYSVTENMVDNQSRMRCGVIIFMLLYYYLNCVSLPDLRSWSRRSKCSLSSTTIPSTSSWRNWTSWSDWPLRPTSHRYDCHKQPLTVFSQCCLRVFIFILFDLFVTFSWYFPHSRKAFCPLQHSHRTQRELV